MLLVISEAVRDYHQYSNSEWLEILVMIWSHV